MSATSPDVTAGRRRRAMRRIAIIAAAVAVAVIGLLRAEGPLSTTTATKAGVRATPSPTVAIPSAPSDIVPSPVIEAHPKFFFGTGDGSAGDYTEAPNDRRQ